MNQSTSEQQKAYGVFATVYDRLMNEKKYTGWNQLIEDVVKKYSIPKGICLDIACGTGRVSKLLLNQGFQVIGVDISDDMIKIARANYPQASFVRADIREFSIGEQDREKIVLAVSLYDSLNYLLTDEDMLKMFKSVAKNLPVGTVFLFDMNTREHVNVSQNNKPRVFEDNDFFVTIRFGGQDRLWILDIDIFLKQPDGSYRFYKEQHIERGYDEEDIAPLLQETGLKLLEIRKEYKVYEDNKEHLSRLYFVTQK